MVNPDINRSFPRILATTPTWHASHDVSQAQTAASMRALHLWPSEAGRQTTYVSGAHAVRQQEQSSVLDLINCHIAAVLQLHTKADSYGGVDE